jgi:tRNA 2-thiocytidine biosynthesis protein TtcA
METANHTPANADRLAHYLLRAVNKASFKYRLFGDGDAVLVAVSGGKDSMTLLDLLWRRQSLVRERYRLVVGHIRSDWYCGRAVPTPWLQAWCDARGLALVVDEMAVADDLRAMRKSRCFRCAWVRRKALFDMADRVGCNKLALAHHADDIAETTLMNLFYNARIASMAPKASLFQGRLTVIRPLALVEERDIPPFARASGFPIAGEPCPEGLAGRRALIKQVLRDLEGENHRVKRSIYAAVNRLRQKATIEDEPEA